METLLENLLLFNSWKLGLTLCYPMDYSRPGSSVHHYLPEFAQIHVHWVGDAIPPCPPQEPLLLLPLIFPSIRVFSNKLALHIKGPKYQCFTFSISLPISIQGWFPLGLTGLISFKSRALFRVFSRNTIWKHQFFNAQPYVWSNSHIHTWLLEKP